MMNIPYFAAILLCGIPVHCRHNYMTQLMQREPPSHCADIDYGHSLACIEESTDFFFFSMPFIPFSSDLFTFPSLL